MANLLVSVHGMRMFAFDVWLVLSCGLLILLRLHVQCMLVLICVKDTGFDMAMIAKDKYMALSAETRHIG